jgi:hypothetical protein
MIKTSLLLLCLLTPLFAAEFKSDKECVVGMKVADRQNLTGKVVSAGDSMCRVQLDSTGKTTAWLFWMLHAAGGSVETNDKLVIGKYNCWVGGRMSAGMSITGPATYETGGKSGRYHIEPSRDIIFESGPYSTWHAHLLAGPKIGMNLNGGTFYNLTCDPAR